MTSPTSSAPLLSSRADRSLLLDGALAPDAGASLAHVPELHVHHGRHQGIVEGIVLPETRNAQVRQDRLEPEIKHRPRRGTAVLEGIIDLRDLDAAIGELRLDVPENILVEHADIEIHVVADNGTPPNEPKQLGQNLVHGSSRGHIARPESVDLDGLGSRNPVSPDDGLVGLARHDPAAADNDRRDGNYLVDPRVEPGRLAIEN